MDLNEDIKSYLYTRIDEFRKEAEDYYIQHIRPTVEEAYDLYNADKEYYKKKFPRISKSSNLVSTDVADTIEWALPSLMKIFMGSDEVVQIEGAEGEDEQAAEVMKKLVNYQLQRKNSAFHVFYNWFKDALITGVGILKCYWERKTTQSQQTQIVNQAVLQQMQAQGYNIVSVVPINEIGDVQVTFIQEYYNKNQPKIENIVPSEFRFSPGYKSLEECPFVAHKKRVTISYLRQKEKEGIFANIDQVVEKSKPSIIDDPIDQDLLDNYYVNTNKAEESAREVDLWECYIRLDINEDGIAEELQVFLVGDVFIRIEQNLFERAPFFLLSPMKDPHRIWPKKSYSKLIGELQDLKIALIRQVMINIARSNDPTMIMSEDAINIQDYIDGRLVIRKKPGFSMSDTMQPVPPLQLHPWTFQFLEYVETQKENRTGITRYNQGLDARSLNKTATGIAQIMSASNQRLELIARIFAETGIKELFRFLIALNQKFVDQATVIRLTNEQLSITPDDLQGDFDLVVNAGVGIATKESVMMNLQTLLTVIMQVLGSGIQIATPQNIYNILRKFCTEMGLKNTQEYLTDPMFMQQLQQMIEAAIFSLLPPQFQQIISQQGLTPEILMQLPPAVQQLLGGLYGKQANQGVATGGGGQVGSPVSAGAVGQQPRGDNRHPQNVPR